MPAASCRSSTRVWRRLTPGIRKTHCRHCAASSCSSATPPRPPERCVPRRRDETRDQGCARGETMMTDFAVSTPTQEPDLDTAMKVVYQWNYEPEVDELRRLYVKGAEAQWVAERDIDWERPIDHEKFATTPLGAALPIERSTYWRSLGAEKQWELTRRTAAFRLSNFLHGEQGALMVAAQLVNAVPHTDAKFYAATQTMDEARHVEVFAKYIKKLDDVRPI